MNKNLAQWIWDHVERGDKHDRGVPDVRGDTLATRDPTLQFDPTVPFVPSSTEYDDYEGNAKLRFHDRRVRFDPDIPGSTTVKRLPQREIKYKTDFRPKERDPFAHTRDSSKSGSAPDERGVQTDLQTDQTDQTAVADNPDAITDPYARKRTRKSSRKRNDGQTPR